MSGIFGIYSDSAAGLVDKMFPSSDGGSSMSQLAADYASIRNGSYGKLMRAYYSEERIQKSDSALETAGNYFTAATAASVSGLSDLRESADHLEEASTALLNRSSSNVFQKDSKGSYDVDAIYEAVSSFVDGYNELMSASEQVSDENMLQKVLNLAKYTSANRSALSYAGISFNEKSEMVVEKEKFQKMDMEAVKNLFQGNGSFASQIMLKAENVKSAAAITIAKASGTYGNDGSYSRLFASGTSFEDKI